MNGMESHLYWSLHAAEIPNLLTRFVVPLLWYSIPCSIVVQVVVTVLCCEQRYQVSVPHGCLQACHMIGL